jgi:hypothetical protein
VGSGFKTFSPGDVLTASDVNNFLMEQSVMSFADAAARTSAIGTANFEEGMVAYLQDTDKIQVYNGTAWVDAANNTGAGLIHIQTTSFSAVSAQSVNNVFTSAYDSYKILISITGASANGVISLKLRAGTSSSANYFQGGRYVDETGAGVNWNLNNVTTGWKVAESSKGLTDINLNGPHLTRAATINFLYGGFNQATNVIGAHAGGIHSNTNAFDGVELLTSTGNITGTIQFFGVKQ